MRRPWAAIVVTALLLIALAGWFSVNVREEVVLPRLGQAPTFELVNAAGESFPSNQLIGQVVLVNFFFTRCPTVCPKLTGEMAKFNRMFANDPRVRLVSISVDPEHDTPAVLSEFGAQYGARPGKWDLLSGSVDAIDALREHGFRVDGGGPIDYHSTRIVLIDATGTIRGFYQGTDESHVARLMRDVPVVLLEDAAKRS